MESRIQRHIEDREHAGWDAVEEQRDIARRFETAMDYGVVLVDSLTLWVNNIMYEAHRRNISLDEDKISQKTTDVIVAARKHPGMIIFVTNEVGLGIVPGNQDARLYRDLVGRCTQQVATVSDSVSG